MLLPRELNETILRRCLAQAQGTVNTQCFYRVHCIKRFVCICIIHDSPINVIFNFFTFKFYVIYTICPNHKCTAKGIFTMWAHPWRQQPDQNIDHSHHPEISHMSPSQLLPTMINLHFGEFLFSFKDPSPSLFHSLI